MLDGHLGDRKDLSIQRLDLLFESFDFPLCGGLDVSVRRRCGEGLEIESIEPRPDRLDRCLDQTVTLESARRDAPYQQ